MTCCGLTKHGLREVAVSTVVLLLAAGILAGFVRPLWLGVALAAVPLAVWAWVLWFFRDPERATPTGPGLIVAPADGCVTDITPLGPQSLLGRDGVQVGIFMNVFSVHVNRSPLDAAVVRVEHRDGVFLDVRRADAWERNESTTIFLECQADGRKVPVVIRQIAGLIARRIVTDLTAGQVLRRGQRIGMIKFGSRMEVLAPRELVGQVVVQIGQNVKAGLDVLIQAPEKP